MLDFRRPAPHKAAPKPKQAGLRRNKRSSPRATPLLGLLQGRGAQYLNGWQRERGQDRPYHSLDGFRRLGQRSGFWRALR